MFSYTKIKDLKLEKVFEVSCVRSLINSKQKDEITKLSKNANIQGFRKGHVPAKFLEEKYGKSVLFNVFEKIIQETINNIVKEEGYRLSSQPKLDFEEEVLLNEQKDFKSTITFSIFPDVPEINLENIVINTYKINVEEVDYEDSVKAFAKQNAQKVKVDRSIKDGDIAKINCVGYVDDKTFEGGKVNDYMLEIGSKSFIDTFEEQLVGKKAGDTCDVFVTFPTEYHMKDVAAKPAKFVVEILAVYEQKPLEINDENIKEKTGVDTVDEFKKQTLENIEKQYNQVVKNSIKTNIFDMIADSLDFDVPPTILQNLIDKTLKDELDYNNRLEESKRKSESEIIQQVGKDCRKKIMLSIYIQDISQKQQITINEQDMMSFVFEESMRTGISPERLISLYTENDKSGNALREVVSESKVYDYIFNKITKNFENITKQKADELVKTPHFSFIKK